MSKKIFYVCSFGGCGSTILHRSLRKYGRSEHIHSRYPPEKLEYVGLNGGGNTYDEWFNGIKIPEDELNNYYVIFIYRNPVYAIRSRYTSDYKYYKEHLKNIQIKNNIELDDVLKSQKDLYKIKEFYNNYTKPNIKRNYKIYNIKYEDIFEKQNELCRILGIEKLDLVNTSKRKIDNDKLIDIYSDLIDEMNNNDFIFIS